jgi:hypothetical protein
MWHLDFLLTPSLLVTPVVIAIIGSWPTRSLSIFLFINVILNSRHGHYILAANLMMILICFPIFFFHNNFHSLMRVYLMFQRIISILVCFLTIEFSIHVARNQTLHIMFIFFLVDHIMTWINTHAHNEFQK